ncbi:bifunctional acetate--CoA ligase family protein/GNAT family N-acetyltransferase [Shewanella colwelliana]|uniref:Protein acetyltransferase n=1 Tax=Shewanella colwelliana TaxID=23 RepID=A0A1E5IYY1_SHECO|nr:bifunctional acetate--CoA ligase family protein/GNAT family N-acetyltransferase [Shewanella colwelliana]MDX1282385.1 bifunctional acetate--CoA ligase family protein/GNAT family N-acetyltransferase [Shewanella colwelliana]OEG72256.1 protein acetyltransferase [Shewanella colwelliana]OEG75749.1 protein acetyltransferase [Shewanella colwelliana]GIU43304.1 protein lysine acetyltransferase [Shewanella colwelliana]
MSQRTLNSMFKPKSVAIIGASNGKNRAGNVVMKNLLSGGFSGPIMPVTPKYEAVLGVLAYPNIESLPLKPDLAIICTAAPKVPAIVERLAQFGCKVAIINASGMGNQTDADGNNLLELTQQHAKRYGMRILGPNSLGMMLPNLGLNASLAHTSALPGKIAFVSQSAAICTTVLDWANNKGIGFSSFISLGDATDIEFDELLDFLGRDSRTTAILLYIDSINEKRHFLSAARAAARNKPILVIKSGRSLEGTTAAKLHTGGIGGNDAVYEAAFRRAGMLRVNDLIELFAAVETLAHSSPLLGERLAIMTNGGGPAVLALDQLMLGGGKAATLDRETFQALDSFLPNTWSGQNPVDIGGDADATRYAQVLEKLMDSNIADAILVLHSPSALGDSVEIANQLSKLIANHPNRNRVNVLTNWSGEDSAYQARKQFNRAGIPTYRTPEGAVGAFMHMVEYRRNQKLLQEVPQSIPDNLPTNVELARQTLQAALEKKKRVLETHESTQILKAYGLNTIETFFANNAAEAGEIAQELGFPVALKVQSPDIHHKSDVHGVMLNLTSKQEVVHAADAIMSRVHSLNEQARIEGIIVQKMALTAGAQEIRVAVINDPVFGPAILLGEGGSEWQPATDAAVALPPLNMTLARYMVIQALKTHKLKDRHLPLGLNMHALCVLLTQISHLIIDCPEIQGLDLNPVLCAGEKITLLDVNIQLQESPQDNSTRLAICPYPKELEQRAQLKNGRDIMLRPILPEDEPKHLAFDNSLSDEDRYKRYFGVRSKMTHEEMAVLTQIDYAREMAFIATAKGDDGEEITLGAIRASIDPDNTEAEFAMAVRSDHQGQGLGKLLLEKLIDYYKANDTEVLTGFTMFENRSMANLAKRLGFTVTFDMEEHLIKMDMALKPTPNK